MTIEYTLATTDDLPRVLEIYNQTIACRYITSDLAPVSMADRQEWFDSHLNDDKHPIWVVKTDEKVVGWCSFSVFYGRVAYAQTVEVSIYLDSQYQQKGLGSQVIEFLKSQMSTRGIKTLLAFIFKGNQPSINCFLKNGFEIWGDLPNIADMQTHHESLCILGYHAKS
ncbi:GNAT family N-acetyltransferase [Basilea psittacipulmonis]|uniref:N-acetyltransferase domain-containing protein n=1 Tax=Basilea psittacipulmonis DSM 24701 TaxID=1072685 RepID=A0A077DB83_9BURK|nr:GNAT family N-acetyltransferase [Basilea psittacipulmonis]AIL31929.1 hypothetical protein IX83_00045 [Basilea psittacipulmonis DSM 24701]